MNIAKEICNLIETDTVTMSRGAEILGVSLRIMREIYNEWSEEDELNPSQIDFILQSRKRKKK